MPTLTMSDLIDETLENLYREIERPWQSTVGSNALSDTSDTSLTLSGEDGDNVERTDLLEIGRELMLVTAKTDAATPVFTVQRGYLDTPKAAAAAGSVVVKNPPWPRFRVEAALRRLVSGSLNTWLPNVTSQVMNRATGLQYVELPADTIEVKSVRYMNTLTGRVIPIGGWHHERFLPSGVVSNGQLLRLPSVVANDDDLIVTYTAPYEWTGSGDEDDTIVLPDGAGDIPSLWAAAYLVARREVSRLELDRAEEWNQETAVARLGANARLVRELWGEFYRRLDDARKIYHVPRHRPFEKMPKVI